MRCLRLPYWFPAPRSPKQTNDKSDEKYLPDVIIADIVTRLPAELLFPLWVGGAAHTAIQISKEIYPHCLHALLSQTTPVIASENIPTSTERRHKFVVTFIYKDGKQVTRKTKVGLDVGSSLGSTIRLFYSYNGFLLFKSPNLPKSLFIWNPVTDEKTIINSPTNQMLFVCGFFLHPISGEFNVIYFCYESWEYYLINFVLFSLGTKSLRKITSSNTIDEVWDKNAILVNQALHWMVSDRQLEGMRISRYLTSDFIIVYNTETEHVSTMKHPRFRNHCREIGNWVFTMNLQEVQGKLWYCDVDETQFNIWILQDYEQQGWSYEYRMETSSIMRNIYRLYNVSIRRSTELQILHVYIADGELMLCLITRAQLFMLNVNSGVIIKGSGWKYDRYRMVATTTHVNTLVSFSDMIYAAKSKN